MAQTVAGTEISISAAIPVTYTAAGYAALAYSLIGEITDGGSHGRVYAEVKHQPIATRGTQKFKGSFDEGTMTLQLAIDSKDPGQIVAKKAVDLDANHSIKVKYQNGDIDYFQAMVLSFPKTTAGVDTMVAGSITLSITTSKTGIGIIEVAAA